MEQQDWTQLRHTLSDAGFVELDTNFLVILLMFFATALRDGPMSSSFQEINDRVGTANGIASGRVCIALDELQNRGYLRTSEAEGVALTPRGLSAVAVAGLSAP